MLLLRNARALFPSGSTGGSCYPAHTLEQTTPYVACAGQHDLLTSSGSDSHGPEKKLITYRADLSRKLLERLGVQIL